MPFKPTNWVLRGSPAPGTAEQLLYGEEYASKFAASPLLDILQYAGLTDGLELLLDAGDSNSYPGSGQFWFDLSGHDRDFVMGAGDTVEGRDPTFVSDGIKSHFTWEDTSGGATTDRFIQISTDTAWVDSWHKDGAVFSLLVIGKNPSSAFKYCFGTSAGNGPGIAMGVGSVTPHPQVRVQMINASAVTGYVFSSAGGPYLRTNEWGVMGWSADEPAGLGTIFSSHSGAIEHPVAYVSPATGAVSVRPCIGTRGGDVSAWRAGQISAVAAWTGRKLTQYNFAEIASLIRGRYN